jgi:hypothetical protein
MRLHKLLFAALALTLFKPAVAGQDPLPVGARSAGLGHASITLSDVWCLHHNQAGLGNLNRFSAGVYYESRFMMPEMGLNAAAMAMPLGKGALGFSFRSFGYKAYQDAKLGLAYGRKFGDNLNIGMQLNYQRIAFADFYGQRSTFTAEVGAMYTFGSRLTLGAHVYNPGQAKLAEYDNERVPALIRFGGQYRFSKQVMMVAEVEGALYANPTLKTGIEYAPVPALMLRAGLSSTPREGHFGFSVLLKKLQIDVAGSFHPVLGFTPKMGLTFNPASSYER